MSGLRCSSSEGTPTGTQSDDAGTPPGSFATNTCRCGFAGAVPERRDSADTGLDSDARREFVDQLASIKKSRNVRTFAERFRLPG